MKTIILSLALMPNIDYLKSIYSSEKVIIEKQETYKKQSFRNRYLIAGPNGIQTLIIPKKKDNHHKCKTFDVEISYDTDWQTLHWKSIETAYNSSAFFLYYKDDFKKIFSKHYKYLWELNLDFLMLILASMGIKKELIFTEKFVKIYEDAKDLREKIEPKKSNIFQTYPVYYQVFSEKYPFKNNLSSMDLLFNLGPDCQNYLSKI